MINLGVTAVIFVAAISEYDQKLFEDASTNRMVEALDLFEVISMDIFIIMTRNNDYLVFAYVIYWYVYASTNTLDICIHISNMKRNDMSV